MSIKTNIDTINSSFHKTLLSPTRKKIQKSEEWLKLDNENQIPNCCVFPNKIKIDRIFDKPFQCNVNCNTTNNTNMSGIHKIEFQQKAEIVANNTIANQKQKEKKLIEFQEKTNQRLKEFEKTDTNKKKNRENNLVCLINLFDCK